MTAPPRDLQPAVLKALARWPHVPEAFGWLLLDRRGQWRIRDPATEAFEPIGNARLRDFIAHNYTADGRGRWYFQNGPQRVFAKLAYTPLVVRTEGASLVDQCGHAFEGREWWLDEEGSVLVSGPGGVALVHDHDLAQFAEASAPATERWGRIARSEVAARFGFDPDPVPPR